MHILHMPAWYRTPENPHLGNFFREQIFALRDKGHQCGVIYPQYTYSFKNRFSKSASPDKEAFDDEGVWTVRNKINPILPFNMFTKQNIQAFKKEISKVFDEYVQVKGKPDVIHAHGIFMGAIGAHFLSEKYKVPFVNTEQFTGLIIGNQTDNKVLNDLFLNAFKNASKIILCTRAFRDSLIERYGFDKSIFSIIPNMVNPLFLGPKPLPKTDEFRFTNIAYLKDKKNHQLLIEAFDLVHKKNPNIRLDIIGNGELKESLLALVKQKGLADKISFLGLLDRQEVKDKLDASHASILTSKIETFGVCVIESLAAGRPAIATKCGGPEEIITPNDGFVVEEHVPNAVAAAIEKMIQEYDKFDSIKISERCKERYSATMIADRLSDLYSEVLKTPSRV